MFPSQNYHTLFKVVAIMDSLDIMEEGILVEDSSGVISITLHLQTGNLLLNTSLQDLKKELR